MQRTLKGKAVFLGQGLHSGRPVRMSVFPAPANHGITFRRSDAGATGEILPARWDKVEQTPLCTRLVGATGDSVSTVEHVMAALAGLGIHNAMITLDGPEVPILDGSAAPFVRGILAAGVEALAAPARVIEILEPIEVRRGDAVARLDPADGVEMSFDISFPDAAIGTQSRALNLANGAFIRDLCDSRTFCRQSDVDAMHAAGLALGGTLENAVVVDGDRIVTPGGLRHSDEPVRHKMLDALGDLAMAGGPILGRYSGHKAGHALTNELLRQLFARPEAWRMIDCDPELAARLPGVGVSVSDLALCA
ncbi:UDP-3-O-acyl-N-acetylglucosamine deacetylase [Mangrovicoccus algicola]|uniref:UDP-3-O-acyl-N-acetylglucosamine deacetylase n=1 Tax=Mangrovicoccus algicola TaxID=2771008 RepID=A0A8J7D008_9RHOB|nr:UDP-3-O-acyl-N-acetylglucosamine deacetylase [Mangrovicoccus algicola]MBE3638758.1 UDP-3-O-acyl-N-acetylglucosamine deacetylase [Mangrovicoccus algicola]